MASKNPLNDTIEYKDEMIKILNLIIWYSEIVEKLIFIFDPFSSEQKIMNVLIQLGNIPEIASISKFINEKIFGFQKEEGVRISEKEKKIIFQMLRGQFIFKFLSKELKTKDLISFIPYLNNLRKRIKISKQEFFYGFEMTKKMNKNFKIVFPKFEPIDILYIFISYDSDNKYTTGILFNMIAFNFRAQDIVYNKSDLEKKEKMINIWTNISVDLYMNITNDKDIPIKDTLKIKEYLYNKISTLNEEIKKEQIKKDIVKKITDLLKNSKYYEVFDEVILQKNKNPEILKPDFDDFENFIKDNEQLINDIKKNNSNKDTLKIIKDYLSNKILTLNKEVNEEVKNFQKKKDIIKKITVLFNCSKYCEIILQ